MVSQELLNGGNIRRFAQNITFCSFSCFFVVVIVVVVVVVVVVGCQVPHQHHHNSTIFLA